MKKTMYRFMLGAAVVALMLGACADPSVQVKWIDEERPLTENEWVSDDELKSGIVFADAGLVAGSDSVKAEAVAGTIAFPVVDGPWTAAFVSGRGSTHNGRFDIVPIEPDGEDAGLTKANLVIKGDELEWGHYSVRVKVANEDGLAFIKIFEFDVTLCPPLFKDAPKVYPIAAKTDGSFPTLDMQYATGNIPDIAGGKNKLVIRWEKRATAIAYAVYVSKSDAFSEAKPLTSPYAEVPGTGMMSVEMTDFPGDTATGYLPDSTTYWVWTTATNDLGTTPPSPAAKKKTSTPVQAFFYEASSGVLPLFDCGYADYYRFTETTIKYWMGGTAGGYNYLGNVVYHEVFDPPSEENNSPFPNVGKHGEDCRGEGRAGVFIIKYQEGRVPKALTNYDNTPGKMKRYSAVYYWGMDGERNQNGQPITGSNIVNQWAGYAETVTLEEAMDKFTCANVRTFLGLTPEPYTKSFTTAEIPYEPWTDD